MTSIEQIEKSTKAFADAHETLTAIVTDLNTKIEALQRAALPAIKSAVAKAAEKQDQLKFQIERAPECFIKPRTVIFHGIKVGMTKGKGGIDWADEDRVIELIKKHFPDQKDALITTTEKPKVAGLNELSVADLKRIGCYAEDTGDVVVIKPTDGSVAKIVKALLKGATDETEAA